MKKNISIFLIFLVLLYLAALGGYRMGLFGGKTQSYKYDEDDTALDNPYIGYAPSATNKYLCDDSRLVYLNLIWSELEPVEGEFNWSYIEDANNLGRWKRAGKNLVLRFVCDLPNDEDHMDIPQWLYDKTGDGEFYDMEYGKGYCPDYNNKVFIEEHGKVIAEIGRHFEGDGFLAYVELGSLGHWGEWHTYYPAGVPRMPGYDVRKKYVEQYEAAFPYAKLLMRRPFKEMPDGWGVFNDMTGEEEDTTEWLEWINEGGEYNATGEVDGIKAVPEVWNTAPVGGEFTSSRPMTDLLKADFEDTMRLIEDSHMSFIGPKIPDYKREDEIEGESKEVLSRVGYRYRISSMELKTPFMSEDTSIKISICNDGVAPLYFEFTPYIYVELPRGIDIHKYENLVDGYGLEGTEAENMLKFRIPVDLMELCQGDSREFTLIVPRSLLEYSDVNIYAGIESPQTESPEISLGMDRARKGKLTLLWNN